MTDIYKPEGYYIDSPENKEYISSIAGLEYAFAMGIPLEAKAILCDKEHNLIVELGENRGIIPKEEVLFNASAKEVRDIAIITRVGKAVRFKITEIDKSTSPATIILSRRLAQEECYENYIKQLVPGDIIDAKITHQEQFGCFCDIGAGFISLLSVDCISVSRISHPKDRFFVGQYIKAIVKENSKEDGRITLTHKELLGTWQENAAKFSPGETTTGIIRSIEPYGIFIELSPNLAGLAEWKDGVYEGQCAAVYIKNIIPDKMKVKLVIVDCSSEEKSFKAPEYYIDVQHIDYWKYSPDSCEKIIESIF